MSKPGARPDRRLREIREVDRARLRELAATLEAQPGAPRFIDYREAESLAESLAAKLVDRIPPSELREHSCQAVPRGGFVVLGLLSYALDLRRGQLELGDDESRPLLVVDDCALTGARFAELLRSTSSRRVTFAHLCSAPALRRAIRDAEDRVERCVSALDLEDLAPRLRPDPAEYEAWRERWLRRLGPGRYWVGEPELVAFPWSEPDRLLWNRVSGRVESGWRFLPPDRCLARRWSAGRLPVAGGARQLRVPQGVVSGRFEDRLLLCHRRRDRIYSLAEPAGSMWEALAAYGRLDLAGAHLLRELEVEPERLARELADLLEQLLALGLLESCGAG